MKLFIVGCGLIGTSVALAARRAHPDAQIVGVDPHGHDAAAARGVFDVLVADPADLTADRRAGVDVAVVATPPDAVAAAVKACAQTATLVVDVGSVKAPIVAALGVPGPTNFVPSHPMAGSHLTGAGAARAELIEGRVVFVTPAPELDERTIAAAEAFWSGLGARTVRLSPAEHDAVVAFTSHLPHLLAWAFVGSGEALPAAIGTGYRDFTRLAKADPRLWSQILRSNAAALGPLLDALQDDISRLRDALGGDDPTKLIELLSERQRRALAADQAG